MLAAALLHDSVEDQPERWPPAGPTVRSPRAAALSRLATDFGARTARAGFRGHQPGVRPGPTRNEQYLDHLSESLGRDPWARVIKASDFTDNGVGRDSPRGARAARLARKYRPLVPLLRELVARPDTPLEASVKCHINAQLDLAEGQFRSILG